MSEPFYCNIAKAYCYAERPHGEWEKYGDKIEAYDIAGHKTWGQKRKCTNCGFVKTYIEDFGFYSNCPSCGASMSANDRQVTGKLNSEIEKSKSEIVPDYHDGWRLRGGAEK